MKITGTNFLILKAIFRLLGEDKSKLLFILLLIMCLALLEVLGLAVLGPYIAIIVNPELINGSLAKVIYALGLPSEIESLVIVIGIILLAIFSIKILCSLWANSVIIKFGQNQQLKLRSHLMQIYQQMPYTDFIDRNSSEYIYNIQSLVTNFSVLLIIILGMVSSGIIGLGIGVFLAWSNPYVMMMLLILLGVSIFTYNKLFRHRLVDYGKRSNIASVSMIQGINESMSGLKEIRIFGDEPFFYNKVRKDAKDFSIFQTKLHFHALVPRHLLEFVIIFFVILLVMFELFIGKDLQTLAPTLGLFGFAAIRILPIATVLSSGLNQFHARNDGVFRLYKDFIEFEKNTLSDTSKSTTIKPVPFSNFEMSSVEFSYPGMDRKILTDISLKIESGESIGIIGPSGSGKTTLIDLMLGLLAPQTGVIKYNGEVSNSAFLAWRSQIAYLPQDIFLMDDTLRNNIILGKEFNELKLRSSIKQARLTEFVSQLAEGVGTVVGERGVRISGGQRQRIALARAFYHETNILIMDESTSALDSKTEREITDEIKLLKGKKTLIVIAHRLSTLQHCDRIYRIENGSIVSVGVLDDDLNFTTSLSGENKFNMKNV